jgi:hypothetical protein
MTMGDFGFVEESVEVLHMLMIPLQGGSPLSAHLTNPFSAGSIRGPEVSDERIGDNNRDITQAKAQAGVVNDA